jgi:hypothetical protein
MQTLVQHSVANTLRDYYEGRAQLQSVPSQLPQQEMTPQDAFMLGQIVTALNIQE